MRSEAPPLLPIFRSRHQADLLNWLLLRPDHEYTLTDLATRLEVPLTTLHREAQRLVDAQLLLDRSLGRSRLLRANPSHRATASLTQLLIVTFGPHIVVEDEFAGVDGVDRVLIYGSWAARYRGEPGPPPADLDILVIGTSAREDVYDAADRVQERLAMPSTRCCGPSGNGSRPPTRCSPRCSAPLPSRSWVRELSLRSSCRRHAPQR